MKSNNLDNNVVVITGASSGFGEMIARACVANGAQVVLAARTAATLEQIADQLGPQRALAVPTDVTRDADVQQLVAATLQRFGRADALVNSAGFGVLDRIADAPLRDLQAMMDVNVYGTVRCTKAFLPHMLDRRSGQLIHIASLGGLVATANMGFYCATKFAVVGLTRSLMLELSGTGVRCALICPGVAMTNFMQQADINKFARATRLVSCTPSQVADTVLRAIARRTHGEILVPGRGRMFAALIDAFPTVSRGVLRVVR